MIGYKTKQYTGGRYNVLYHGRRGLSFKERVYLKKEMERKLFYLKKEYGIKEDKRKKVQPPLFLFSY